jgi:hypothetical protein
MSHPRISQKPPGAAADVSDRQPVGGVVEASAPAAYPLVRLDKIAHLRDLKKRVFDLDARFPPPPRTAEEEISVGRHRFTLPADRQREELRQGLRLLWDGERLAGFVGGPEDPVERRRLEQQFCELATEAGILLGYPPERALDGVLDLLRRESAHVEPKLLIYVKNIVLALAEYLGILESRALRGAWPLPAATFVPPQIASPEISPPKPVEIPAADTSDLKQSGETEPGGDRQVPAEGGSGPEEQPPEMDFCAEQKAFTDKILKATGKRITGKDIWLVAGYNSPTELGDARRNKAKSGIVSKFRSVFRLEAEEFIERLETAEKAYLERKRRKKPT